MGLGMVMLALDVHAPSCLASLETFENIFDDHLVKGITITSHIPNWIFWVLRVLVPLRDKLLGTCFGLGFSLCCSLSLRFGFGCSLNFLLHLLRSLRGLQSLILLLLNLTCLLLNLVLLLLPNLALLSRCLLLGPAPLFGRLFGSSRCILLNLSFLLARLSLLFGWISLLLLVLILLGCTLCCRFGRTFGCRPSWFLDRGLFNLRFFSIIPISRFTTILVILTLLIFTSSFGFGFGLPFLPLRVGFLVAFLQLKLLSATDVFTFCDRFKGWLLLTGKMCSEER